MDQSDTREARFSDDKGRRPAKPATYYLVCLSCGSRLEVTAALAGHPAKCPTCGVGFEVPSVDKLTASEGESILVGQPPDERMAVHAYAAAGDMAPEVAQDDSGRSMIRCRRCGTMSRIDAESCRLCGIPFTIEAGTGIHTGQWSGWTVASLFLGVLSLVTYPWPVLAVAAIITGLMAVKGLYVQYNGLQRLAAWLGVVLGGLSLAAFAIEYISKH
jgi:ribosomal protein L40E